MAQTLNCDVCGEENAVQMLTDLTDGTSIAIGAACIPMFLGQAVLTVMGAGDHKGPANRCQACRRVHERMTTPVAPLEVPDVSGAGVPYPPDTADTAADAP